MAAISDTAIVAFTVNFMNTEQCSVSNMLMLLLEKLKKKTEENPDQG